METSLTLSAIIEARQSLFLNALYWCSIMCVVFKLTWITRQVSDMQPLVRWPLVCAATTLSTILLFKGYLRFDGGDDAQFLDVARELSLCMFLIFTIILIRQKTERY